jgi:hypothetical protein
VSGDDCLRYPVRTGSGAHPTMYAVGTWALSQGVKRPKRDVLHLPPSSAEVENAWSSISTSIIDQGSLWLGGYFNVIFALFSGAS